MFESDDFDQVLSQFDFSDVSTKAVENVKDVNIVNGVEVNRSQTKQHSPLQFLNHSSPSSSPHKVLQKKYIEIQACASAVNQTAINTENVSPKHTKRKMINSYFDHNAKRKFPGPAGLLSGNFEESRDETICHMELFSQDIDIADIGQYKFESHVWRKLSADIKNFNLGAIDTIKAVKQQALAGNLRRRKAQVVTAFVETVDRSVTDPMVTLRDTTGHIKCTLHRDAWSTFSSYIVSEFCALVLRKPTVLTTGSAFKKHYLNITLSNIYAIYSSAVVQEDTDSKPLPEGYHINCDDNITIIKIIPIIQSPDKDPFCNETANDTGNLLDDLDCIFTDDLF